MSEIGQNGKYTVDWIDWIEQGGRGRGVGGHFITLHLLLKQLVQQSELFSVSYFNCGRIIGLCCKTGAMPLNSL